MKLFPGKCGKWHFRALKGKNFLEGGGGGGHVPRPLSGSRLQCSMDVFNGAYPREKWMILDSQTGAEAACLWFTKALQLHVHVTSVCVILIKVLYALKS